MSGGCHAFGRNSPFLVTVDSKHVLQVIAVLLAGVAASTRAVSYALYCAAMASLVLIAEDVAHPTNFSAEWRRILFTFLGLAIGIAVLGIGGLDPRSTLLPVQRRHHGFGDRLP